MYLQLRELSKLFPGRAGSAPVVAVDHVDLTIEEGQLVTLLGPSGCGKTTTLRLIAGFEFPSSGEIILDGENINERPPNRRDMAMVFQSYAVFPHLSVFENIAYGLRVQKKSGGQLKKEVAYALELTELNGLENRQPNQLSGGQQQRVALARALVMQPKVLLFDEPLSNLDAKLRVQMRSEIRRIQQELGITSVYVTHDQDEAMVLSDMIVVMNDGRVQQQDSAVEIYRRPVNRFVADFIGSANFLPVEVLRAGDENHLVRLGSLEIESPARFVAQAGEKAILLARPESVELRATTEESSGLVGRVVRSAYLGSLAEYEVEAFGQTIAAVQHAPAEKDLFHRGDRVAIELSPQNLFLLPEG